MIIRLPYVAYREQTSTSFLRLKTLSVIRLNGIWEEYPDLASQVFSVMPLIVYPVIFIRIDSWQEIAEN